MNTAKQSVQRDFFLGDEWLYYKIYTGHKTADKILTEVILPVTSQLIDQELIKKWFFIRYSDPNFHLRVRFCFEPENIASITNLMNDALKPYKQENLLYKIQTDTYSREIERYGDNTIELAETIFYHDSNMIVKMIDMIEGDEGEQIRWLFAMKAVNTFLDDCHLNEENKVEFMNRLAESFGREHNMNKNLKRQLDNKFRQERSIINNILDSSNDDESEMKPLLDYLKEKSENIKPVISQILELKESNELNTEFNSLVGSYIHMLLNRLFKSKNRLHELVIYYFLHKHLKSELARKKYSKK